MIKISLGFALGFGAGLVVLWYNNGLFDAQPWDSPSRFS